MTQPFDRGALLPALGKLDEEGGQFWVENPWLFHPRRRYNLSMYERNRVFLNVDGQEFVDISYISGADTEADSRGVAVADFNNDGMPDLLVRNVGGRPVQLFENRFPCKRYLKVSLRGMRSNRFGIGAGLLAQVGKRQIWRELYPTISFLSQLPPQVIFGLGKAKQVDRLTVYWPSGLVQHFSNLQANQHLRLTEGKATPEVIVPR